MAHPLALTLRGLGAEPNGHRFRRTLPGLLPLNDPLAEAHDEPRRRSYKRRAPEAVRVLRTTMVLGALIAPLRAAAQPKLAGSSRQATAPKTQKPRSTNRGIAVLVTCGVVMAGCALAVYLPITDTVRTQGVLHSRSMGTAVKAPLTGTVREVAVAAGERVVSGQALLTMDLAQTRAKLAGVSAQLARIEQRKRTTDERRALRERSLDALRAQADVLARRMNSARRRVEQINEQLKSPDSARDAGAAHELAAEVALLSRENLAAEQELANNRVQQLAFQQESNAEQHSLESELSAVLEEQRLLEAAVQAGTLRAPTDGVVQALQVDVGDSVEAGGELARIVPPETPTLTISYVSTRQSKELQPGTAARVRVATPRLGIVAIEGKLNSVSSEAAPERASWTAPNAATHRVDVDLTPSAHAEASLQQMLPGSPVTVFLRGRQRRVLDLLKAHWQAFADEL